ncbi:MAG: NnrS family protein [Hylemonella sp.]|nr:NnrS family protein [Hylemonella sp.]MDP1936795.1 NnrS family protein [Hylemonella sp.]
MGNLLQINEPETPERIAPSLQAFLEMGFRPLYLAGAAWALVAVALWIFWPQLLQGPLAGVAWHAHEMMWGFVATIAVGFLMTAGANWTGVNPMPGPILLAACVLWLVARVGLLAGTSTMFWLGFGAEAAFFLLACVAMARAVYGTRNRRNYAVPVLLLGLGATDVLYLLAALDGDYTLLMQRFNAGLLCMAVIALLVGRRVIPFFAMRAVPGLSIPMQERSGLVQLGAGALAVLFVLLQWQAPLALTLLVAGGVPLWQLLTWKPWTVRRKPLLWILYAGYAGLGAGLLVAAAQAAGLPLRTAVHVHVIAMGGFSVLIIGMVTRTALGHLGRPLAVDRSMTASYVLMLLAFVLRLAALHPSMFSTVLLQGAALAWIASLALYLWRFFPWMIRPRPDRAAAPATVIVNKRP